MLKLFLAIVVCLGIGLAAVAPAKACTMKDCPQPQQCMDSGCLKCVAPPVAALAPSPVLARVVARAMPVLLPPAASVAYIPKLPSPPPKMA